MSYSTEVLPCELLAIYSSLVIAAFCNPIGMENIGYNYYIVFCCLLAVFLAVTYFFFPETKGRSLEEIAEIFDGPNALPNAEETERKMSKTVFEEYTEERIERA